MASGTPWTRGPSCGWRAKWQPGEARAGAHADVHRPAPAVVRARHVRDHGCRVHHLLQDPARALAGRSPSPQTLAEIRAQLGLDRPFPIQYGIMMKKIFITRDLVSYSNQGVRVVQEVFAATPATLSLVFGAAVLWVVMAIGVGIAAALLRGTVFDPLIMVVALVGVSAPVFWVGQIVNMISQGTLHDTFLFSW